jgi:hypothetical protein
MNGVIVNEGYLMDNWHTILLLINEFANFKNLLPGLIGDDIIYLIIQMGNKQAQSTIMD